MNYRLFILLFLLPLQFVFAQNFSISGKVIDKNTRQPLSFSTLALLDSEHKIIRGINIPENGQFKIENLSQGNYSIQITFLGYETYAKAFYLNKNLNLETIAMSVDSKSLKEVEITAEKDLVTMDIGKKVFNVGKDLSAISGTAESLLQNIPSISIDDSGNPSLRNRPTTIYIDGKPTQLTLNQIPANQIESVEVISNPSAKYDASTTGGIVNLILKKNRENGYNGNATAGVGNNNRYNGSVNLNYHQNKWNFSAMFNINTRKNPVNTYVDRTNYKDGIITGYFKQNTLREMDNQFIHGRLAIDNDINKKNTVGFGFRMVKGIFNSIDRQNYDYLNPQNVITSSGLRNTIPDNFYQHFGLELNWKHRFERKKEEFDVRLSASQNQSGNDAKWFTSAINADGTHQPGYPENDIITGQQIGYQYLGQFDYVRPLNDSSKIEMGFRSFTYIRDQNYFFNRVLDGRDSLIQDFSQDNRIVESVNAVYFLFNKKLKNNFHLETGLRLEQSLLDGYSRFDGRHFGYHYPTVKGGNWFQAFFPSFALSKKINKDAEIGLSLGRKIGRPSWRHMFVGIRSNDRQNMTIGNPSIKPEFDNTFELNYSQDIKKVSWVASAYYIYEDHTIKPFVTKSTEDTTVLITTFINSKADIQMGLDNTLKFTLGNLSTTANVNVFRKILSTYTSTANKMWAMRSKLNLTYKLPAKIKIQLNLNGSSKIPGLQGYSLPVYFADIAISKSIYDGRGNITFGVHDIFNSRKYRSVFISPELIQTSMDRRDTRYYKLSVQIPLGKPNVNFKKKERRPESSEEMDFGVEG